MKITKKQIDELNFSFKRIFALPISPLTIREVQNSLKSIFTDGPEIPSSLYESFLRGKTKENLNSEDLSELIDRYTLLVQLAHEVSERGEFINSFTCDFLQKGNQLFFLNRMRRIDAKEYHFLSSPDTNIRLAHMFINRLHDVKKTAGESIKFEAGLKKELEELKQAIESLLDTRDVSKS